MSHDVVTGAAHSTVASVGAYIANAAPDEFVSFLAGLFTVVYMSIMIFVNSPRIVPAFKHWRERFKKRCGRK